MSASERKGPSFVFVISILTVFALGALVAIPNFIRARTPASKCSCTANIKQLDGAKATWALEKHKTNTDTPAMTDIIGPPAYIRDAPVCPLGGQYILGRVEQMPRCTVPEHFLYSSEIRVVSEAGLGLGGVQIEVQRTNARLCV